MVFKILFILLLFISLSLCYEFNEIEFSKIPIFNSRDEIEIYNLQAGFFKSTIGPIFEPLKLMHSAIGFVNKQTNVTWWVCYNFFLN